jgi:hypothetical protein
MPERKTQSNKKQNVTQLTIADSVTAQPIAAEHAYLELIDLACI